MCIYYLLVKRLKGVGRGGGSKLEATSMKKSVLKAVFDMKFFFVVLNKMGI